MVACKGGRIYLVVAYLIIEVIGFAIIMAITFMSFKTKTNQEFSWVGAVQSTQAAFRVRAPKGTTRIFAVSTSKSFLNDKFWIFSQSMSFPNEVSVIPVLLDNLTPETLYFYGQIDEEINEVVWSGSFSTPPPENTSFNFTVAISGCAMTASDTVAYMQILHFDPFLMLHAGDFHYLDQRTEGIDPRVSGIGRVFEAPNAAKLYSSLSVAYTWDDHDYCGNNVNRECPRKEAARKAYQKAVPHYPLAAASLPNAPPPDTNGLRNIPIYQAFTIGTVRFVITDLRSEAAPNSDPDPDFMISKEQQDWLFSEFDDAFKYSFIVWVSSKPWIGEDVLGFDSWRGFPNQRAEISEHIAQKIGSMKGNLLFLSSDSHVVAFDNGRNTMYGSNKTFSSGFPSLESGPLRNSGPGKGGPYTGGCYGFTGTYSSQFSILDFVIPESEEPYINIRSFRSENSKLQVLVKKTLQGNIFFPLNEVSSTDPGEVCNVPIFATTPLALLISAAVLLVIPTFIVLIFLKRRHWCFVFSTTALTIVAILFAIVLCLGIPALFYFSPLHFASLETTAAFSTLLVLTFTYATYISAFTWQESHRKNKVDRQ